MTNRKQPDRPANGVEGEGSYTAARDYQRSVRAFMEKHGEQIEEFAEDAEHALESAEGEELRNAETEGLKKSRH